MVKPTSLTKAHSNNRNTARERSRYRRATGQRSGNRRDSLYQVSEETASPRKLHASLVCVLAPEPNFQLMPRQCETGWKRWRLPRQPLASGLGGHVEGDGETRWSTAQTTDTNAQESSRKSEARLGASDPGSSSEGLPVTAVPL